MRHLSWNACLFITWGIVLLLPGNSSLHRAATTVVAAGPALKAPVTGLQPTFEPTPTSVIARNTPDQAASSPIEHGDRTLPYIALTFDACQSPHSFAVYDEAVVRVLASTSTPATLFLGGLWMQHHPAQTRLLAANPLFELGNHSWSHSLFTRLTPDEVGSEIKRTQQLMLTLTGQEAALFRFPYNIATDEALDILARQGIRAVSAEVITGDPDPDVSARDIIQTVRNESRNGSIILMHVNGWGRHTAEALPEVIKQLRQQGYTFVTVSQLLELAARTAPTTAPPAGVNRF